MANALSSDENAVPHAASVSLSGAGEVFPAQFASRSSEAEARGAGDRKPEVQVRAYRDASCINKTHTLYALTSLYLHSYALAGAFIQIMHYPSSAPAPPTV